LFRGGKGNPWRADTRGRFVLIGAGTYQGPSMPNDSAKARAKALPS